MSRNLRMMRRVRDTRKRLRDVAAGAAAVADQETLARTRDRDERDGDLGNLFDSAPARFAAATTPNDFERFDLERRIAAEELAHAEKLRQLAEEESQRRRLALFERERALRTSEKILEHEKSELVAKQAREEQKLGDDIGASRVKSWQ